MFDGKYGIMYSGWYLIYGIFIFITFIGKWLIKKVTVKNVIIAAITASLTHWLLADFTVWVGGGTDWFIGLRDGDCRNQGEGVSCAFDLG